MNLIQSAALSLMIGSTGLMFAEEVKDHESNENRQVLQLVSKEDKGEMIAFRRSSTSQESESEDGKIIQSDSISVEQFKKLKQEVKAEKPEEKAIELYKKATALGEEATQLYDEAILFMIQDPNKSNEVARKADILMDEAAALIEEADKLSSQYFSD